MDADMAMDLNDKKSSLVEEEKAFKMIPPRPTPFEIDTQNKIENASQGISINICASNSTYDGDRAENNERNLPEKLTLQYAPLKRCKLTHLGQEANSFQMWRLNRMEPPNIYDRMEKPGNNLSERPMCDQVNLPETSQMGLIKCNSNNKIGQEQKELCCISKGISISERVLETGVTIRDVSVCDLVALPIISNAEVIRSQLKCKLKLVGACVAVMLVILAIAGLCFMVYYFTLSKFENVGKMEIDTYNVTVTTDEVDMMYNVSNDVSITSINDVSMMYNVANSIDVPVTTDSVHVTTDDGINCFNSRGNCNTSQKGKKISDNFIAIKELVMAARIGNITQVCELLQCGVDVNYRHTKHAVTPLFIASEYGHYEVVKLLLTNDASVDKAGFFHDKKATPLFMASKNGHDKLVELLLINHASVENANSSNIPLHVAVANGHAKVVQLLLKYKAPVDQTYKGKSALLQAAKKGHMNIFELLLAYNASVDKAGRDGRTQLYQAVRNLPEHIVQLLLTYNASVNIGDQFGITPLHEAVIKQRDNIVEMLCEAGADVNAQTTGVLWHRPRYKVGSTALHMAVHKQNMEIVKILMIHKTELLKDKNGFTALDMYIQRGPKSRDITKELKNYEKLLNDRNNYSNVEPN